MKQTRIALELSEHRSGEGHGVPSLQTVGPKGLLCSAISFTVRGDDFPGID